MNAFLVLLYSLLVLGVQSAPESRQKRSHNHGPDWLDDCWDNAPNHLKNPFCEELTTTTPTTTTTTEPTTTTTTEPTTTTTTEPTTTTTEPTTTTTTLPPTTTARHCDYQAFNDSSITNTDFATDHKVISSNNASLNQSVHIADTLQRCKETCEVSLLQDNYECWAFTYSPTERCYLYYYFRPLGFVPSNLNFTGKTLYLKRCSNDPFRSTPTRSTPTPTTTSAGPVTPSESPLTVVSNTTQTTSAAPANTNTTTTPPVSDTTSTGPPVILSGSTSTGPPLIVTDTTRTSPPLIVTNTTTTGPPLVVTDTTTTGPPLIVTVNSTTGPPLIVTSTMSTGPPLIVTGTMSTGPPLIVTPTGTSGVTGGAAGSSGGSGVITSPGGKVVMISPTSFRINGVPSPTPGKCFFNSTLYSLGETWKDTCKYNCECIDPVANAGTCTDICPIYTSIPTNCVIVTLPGQCCNSLSCTNTTATNATVGPTVNGTGCVDINDTCNYYRDSACKGTFAPWARAHCPLRCDFCPGKAPPCVDTISYCDRFDMDDVCTNYKGWARSNCRHSCNMCTAPGWNPDGVNRVIGSSTPTPTVAVGK